VSACSCLIKLNVKSYLSSDEVLSHNIISVTSKQASLPDLTITNSSLSMIPIMTKWIKNYITCWAHFFVNVLNDDKFQYLSFEIEFFWKVIRIQLDLFSNESWRICRLDCIELIINEQENAILFWDNILFWWLKTKLAICRLKNVMLFWNNISFWWLEAESAVCKLKCTKLAICMLKTKLFFCRLKNARLLTCELRTELIICRLKDARLLTCRSETELIICKLKSARFLTYKLKIMLKISRFWTCHISWNLTEKRNHFFSKMTAEILTENKMQCSKQNQKIRMRVLLSKLNMTSCFLSHE